MTSWWCGKSVAYEFCNDDDYSTCYGDKSMSGAGSGRNPDVGDNNDKVSMIMLNPYDPVRLGGVTLFHNDECSGKHGLFYATERLLEKKSYPLSAMKGRGIHNDAVTSLMIPYGLSVDLYTGDGFASPVYTVVGPIYSDPTMRHACVSLAGSFNDKTSSLEVYKTGQLGNAKGYWRSYTQTESLNFTVHYGIDVSTSASTSMDYSESLSYEMHAGIEFMGESISESYSYEISEDIEKTYSYDISVDYSIPCTVKEGEAGVGLY
mmetsp:Transcript_12428/g.15869  ORF Transcript_12428/g.15869 Transcript_12428/m.15869 type:complete len:263 (+) Transcript_12428:232-1020(+)|eukprot:CAMPEP_0170456180 /NCGR_PEP_ID=MMETSP0123-20130129/3901_1 /TAXON_ID=182087 /ORGANISM="Favella ehrenbergii, Strain Fehren 1" /LENGTH=262 /DNA_ID=CAMNT_0010719573 /DNA_START=156 /DNA_END=944 /DNA_ORIENTATION=-